jgi:hypothetical protein
VNEDGIVDRFKKCSSAPVPRSLVLSIFNECFHDDVLADKPPILAAALILPHLLRPNH